MYPSVGRILKNVLNPFEGKIIDFDEWFEFSVENLDESFIGYSDFYKTIRIFERVFKKKKIKVFLYEEFKENNDFFLNDI